MLESILSRRSTPGCFLVWTLPLIVCTSAAAEPQRYALVVGVREYPASDKLTPLAFTEPDATEIAGTLQGAGYEVTLMTQEAARNPGQQRFAPNATLIRKQFNELVKTPFLKNEDCLLIVLEGHGIQLASKTKAEQQTFYFCPADAVIDELKFSEDVNQSHNLIPVQELYDTLKTSAAGVKLLVVDACRNDPTKPDVFRSPNSMTRPKVPTPPGGTAIMLSCSADQRAAEDPELKHGVFSYFLIEALSGKGDLDGDEQINLTELYQYVGNRTFNHVRQKYSVRQMPEFQGEITGWAPLLSVSQFKLAAGAKAGEAWDRNGLAMKFRWCPPGKFTMGSPVAEKDRVAEREEQVAVTLTRGFWLGQHEVTQAEWEKLMGTTIKQQAEKGTDDQTLTGIGNTLPMYYVSWKEATEFCRKLTAQERSAGRLTADWEYALPTEAQWEYACRAGTTTATAFGDRLSSVQANFDGEQPYNGADRGPQKGQPVAVGSYRANSWGLHDMHGNVWEWCRDWDSQKLSGGTDPEVREAAEDHIGRGGGWESQGSRCRSSERGWGAPDYRDGYLGFRLALVPTR